MQRRQMFSFFRLRTCTIDTYKIRPCRNLRAMNWPVSSFSCLIWRYKSVVKWNDRCISVGTLVSLGLVRVDYDSFVSMMVCMFLYMMHVLQCSVYYLDLHGWGGHMLSAYYLLLSRRALCCQNDSGDEFGLSMVRHWLLTASAGGLSEIDNCYSVIVLSL